MMRTTLKKLMALASVAILAFLASAPAAAGTLGSGVVRANGSDTTTVRAVGSTRSDPYTAQLESRGAVDPSTQPVSSFLEGPGQTVLVLGFTLSPRLADLLLRLGLLR
ncbi:MAG: hypothetical protein ACE5HD_10670 [Acidobacteriota bacterium]